ncbi:MAG: tRNA (N(6)-L-threonylcarbamoyladenosine(37)-C(2))-methylthiotransferase MtaB [Proteobacteria bacterium]|nr:MAG: tRNA (N(6)-L-threonylcarbamoyladenosine(37)-C(2))-methylthiotransferase MtaB [Pseudomonadota bacterium]
MPKLYIKTLGCKVNTYDTHALENQFKALGYDTVETPDLADVSVLNTCSVTENADKEARYLLRRFRRENPGAIVVATGCYAQTDSQRLVEMDEVDLVFPNETKDIVAEATHAFVQRQALEPSRIVLDAKGKLPSHIKAVSGNKQGHFKSSLTMLDGDQSQTRAFLKIQDGCNGFCTYCLIPYARGASRSVSPSEVTREVRRLIEAGVKEVVFTGIHLGDYADDLGQKNGFARLLEELFSWPDMVRVRISSLEPRELTEALLKVLATRPELFCDHFHLPLQSGNDRILKAMRRSYLTKEYADNVAMARRYFPSANFGADIIPGFPGETEAEFEETVAFIKACGLNYLHVFPYSKRPNTAAAKYPDHVPADVVKARAATLRALGTELKDDYLRRFVGKEALVLWEADKDAQGRTKGHSTNYLEVSAPSHVTALPGTIDRVLIKGFIEDQRMLGKILNRPTLETPLYEASATIH